MHEEDGYPHVADGGIVERRPVSEDGVVIYSVSRLDDENLKAIKELESRTGRTLLAFSALEVESDKVADDDLRKIQELERELGVMLVAVRH